MPNSQDPTRVQRTRSSSRNSFKPKRIVEANRTSRPAARKSVQPSSTRRKAKSASKPFAYLCAAVAIIVGLAVIKGAIAWGSELFIYTLPVIGGLLKSLELMEVTNVLIFALLGMGLGAITLWLPRRWGVLPKVVPLVIGFLVVFVTGYIVRYHIWVQQVAIQSQLLPAQARQVTDSLLVQATGKRGSIGFFQYTVQVPILPTDLSALKTVDDDDKWFRSELSRFSGLEPGIFTRLFRFTGWGIRVFHILLALITAIIYFAKGGVWANTRHEQQ